MEIISLNNHIIRKALCLSLNEMAVLCDIKQMSQNPKYGHQCVKSKDKMAEWLDLSRATIFNAISTLEVKGYIERTEIGIKPSKFIYDLDSCQEEIGIFIQNGDFALISKKMSELLDGQSKNYTTTVQNLDGDSLKFRLGQSKIYTQDTHIDTQKDTQENNPPISPKGELIVKKQRADKSSLTSPEQIEAFDQFRKLFSGTKRGLATELACFQKHKDWAEVLPCLSQRLQAEITDRENKRKRNLFTPPWPHLSTYLNQRRWEVYAPENIPAPATDYKLNLGLVYPKDEQQGKEQIRIMAEVIGFRNCTQRELEWAYDFQRPYAIKMNDYPIHHYLHNRGLAGTVNDPDDALTVIAHINAQ